MPVLCTCLPACLHALYICRWSAYTWRVRWWLLTCIIRLPAVCQPALSPVLRSKQTWIRPMSNHTNQYLTSSYLEAVGAVLADRLLAVDLIIFMMLTLLDVSSAFDSVSRHNTLLCQLRGLHGTSPRPCIWRPATVAAVNADYYSCALWWWTLGDRAFPAAAAVHALNSLPSSTEMNSHWRPFDGNWKQYSSGHLLARMLISWVTSLLTRDCLVFVRWPCSVCEW